MKVTCLQENLAKGLSIVSRAVSTRSTLPILSNVLLEATKDGLRLSATNLEISVTTLVGAVVHETGSITIPAKLFGEMVATLPKADVELTLNEKTHTVKLVCGKSHTNIKGIEAGEFPPIPEVKSDLSATFDSVWLKNAFNQVVFIPSDADARVILTGVLMKFEPEGLAMMTTDGFRLAVKKLSATYGKSASVVVPGKSIREVVRLLSDVTEEVTIALTTNSQISFEIGKTRLVSRLIEGDFPHVMRLVPEKHVIDTLVKTSDLVDAVRRSSLIAREAANVLRLRVGKESVVISAVSATVGDNENEIEAVSNGEIDIAFNSEYITQALSAFSSESLALEITGETTACILKDKDDESYFHLLMPLQLPK